MGTKGLFGRGWLANGPVIPALLVACSFSPFPARAVVPEPASPKAPSTGRATDGKSPTSGEEAYRNALEGFTRTYARGARPALAASAFARLDWVQRTALLNVVCAADGSPRCLEAVELGLTDGALVVRDHAFRLLLALPVAAGERRVAAAEGILADDRNYRKGQGLWIVERARKYLEGRAK